MAFTGFYQPIQTLPSLAPQPSVLQAQFEKTAQDFMAQQANQKKMEMAQQEQQMRQTEMAAQSLERSQRAKQEQETRQKKIDEEQKKTMVLNAVRAAVMATPGMSQADQVILGKKKAFELGLPTKDIDAPYEARLNAALKNPSPAYLPIAEEAARVLGVTFDKELFKQGYKPEEKMAVSPGQGIYNKATGTWETKPAEKPTMEQELEKARKIEEIKFGYDVKRKGIRQVTNTPPKDKSADVQNKVFKLRQEALKVQQNMTRVQGSDAFFNATPDEKDAMLQPFFAEKELIENRINEVMGSTRPMVAPPATVDTSPRIITPAATPNKKGKFQLPSRALSGK